ncbi:HTH-type transcriptional regulator GltC [Pigmentiphaga humi]|uniref:HTH-type transcriptional regulator GltC n=1 Tax=Pigmentiphaga humi TaxID=2478468 RepID=A0A3P4AZL6_9BURK|nr:LysR family transcriptional regulator [Pigmentiphaga humi]VCU68930.1 HTH-type transcriptional regulator GltC [Pigmentiphaga humi]
MKLDLRLLQAMQAVMTEGTVTAAARRLHRTQSVVSRMIAELEGRLQFALFRRERQRLIPTEAGLAFYRETERAFAALNDIEEAARRVREGHSLPLRLLATSHIVHGLLPTALSRLDREYAGFRFVLEIRQREYVSHWVRNRQFDLGIVAQWEDMPGVDAHPLLEMPLFVAMNESDPLARKRRIGMADLAAAPFIAVRPGTPMRALCDEAFAAAGLRPSPRGETASVLSAGQLAAQGLGATVVDPFVAHALIADSGAAVRPLAPRMTMVYHALKPPGDAPSPVEARLIEHMRAIARDTVARVKRAAGEK